MSDQPFSLFLSDAPDLEVDVLFFELLEAVSRTYALHVAVHPLGSLPVPHEDLIGSRARLTIVHASGERHLHGVVRNLELDYLEGTVMRLSLAPQLDTLAIGSDSRIFQDATAIEIVEILLAEHGVEYELRLVASYEPRDYCVQYQESALAFVERILADEGVFYFFEHEDADGPERLVIADHAEAYTGPAGDRSLHFRPETGGGMQTDQNAALRFWSESAMATSQVSLANYDFVRPTSTWSGGAAETTTQAKTQSDSGLAPRAPGTREHFHHQPSWHHADLLNDRAATALAQERRHAARCHGNTLSRRLSAGHLLRVSGHALGELDGDYVVIQARHEGRGDSRITSERYRMITSFQCVAASVAFRPILPPRIMRQVVESARVVGPSNETIYTDEHGRIKVQFHWDRDGKGDEHTSCWIRAMQPWSGPGMGAQFIPRVGSEVLVAFLGGNVDQPVVLGGLHNATNAHPFPLPDGKTASGIRSNVIGESGGYNEIRFEDVAGGELVAIHAHNDFALEVGGDAVVDVASTQTSRVGGDCSLSSGGKLEHTAARDMILTTAGARLDSVTAKYDLSVGMELTTHVASHAAMDVGGSLSEKVSGTVTRSVEGVCTMTARGGLFVNVGEPEATANSTTFVHGAQNHGATGIITLNSEQAIRLVCGETVLTLSPESVSITSAKVIINGKDETQVIGKDAHVLLSGDAEVSAPNVNVFSSGASVELNNNADVFGTQVRLNCDRGAATSLTEEEEKPETTPLSVTCANAAGEPFGGKQFVLLVDGVRYMGTTGGDGGVTQDVPKDAAHATLTVWIGDYPQGERRVYELALGTLGSADTLEGARARLSNLGYRPGVGEQLDDTTRDALERFQLDRGLDPTAELDTATIAALNQ